MYMYLHSLYSFHHLCVCVCRLGGLWAWTLEHSGCCIEVLEHCLCRPHKRRSTLAAQAGVVGSQSIWASHCVGVEPLFSYEDPSGTVDPGSDTAKIFGTCILRWARGLERFILTRCGADPSASHRKVVSATPASPTPVVLTPSFNSCSWPYMVQVQPTVGTT